MLKTLKRWIKAKVGMNDLLLHSEEIKRAGILQQKTLDEIYWATVFNSAVTDSKWLLHKTFSPGRWAAGYPMLYILYRIYNEVKPKNILEFGLGESSRLAYQYHLAHQESTFTVIEQDADWLNFFSNEIYNISPHTILLDLESKKINGYDVHQYTGLIKALEGLKFDLVIIDGPWGSDHYSRYQVVHLVENGLIADHFMIIIDDYERAGEQETVASLKAALSEKGMKYKEGIYSGAKQTLIICSENYKFLTSL